jgi:hypothetical protein
MRQYEFRTYTYNSFEALERHKNDFNDMVAFLPKFDMGYHGLWTSPGDTEPRMFVLSSYAAGADPMEVVKRFMSSPEVAHLPSFRTGHEIVKVSSTFLQPGPGSPLT